MNNYKIKIILGSDAISKIQLEHEANDIRTLLLNHQYKLESISTSGIEVSG